MGRKEIMLFSTVVILGLGLALTCDGSASQISGGAYFYPETATYRASFSVDITQEGGGSPNGWLKYYYTRTRMNVVSTGITRIEGQGKSGTLYGTCTVNGVGGYTFTATITDGSPDNFGITIKRANGTTYYAAGPRSISGGDLVVYIALPVSLGITITSPADNSTVNTSNTLVRGTFTSISSDVGASVNGLPALISGDNWAVDISLAGGINTITARIVDSDGNAAQQSINVNYLLQPEALSLSVYPESGVAPLQVFFNLSTTLNPSPEWFQIDYEGDGIVDAGFPSLDNLSKSYDKAGIYYPAVIARDSQGNIHRASRIVCVQDRAEIDSLLKKKWQGMKEAFANKDVTKALSFFIDQAKDRYEYNLELLKDFLPAIVQDMRDIKLVNVEDRVAEYEMPAIQDGVEYSFYIKFIKDFDGIWKIYFF